MLAVIYNIDEIFSGFRSRGFEGDLAFHPTPQPPNPHPLYQGRTRFFLEWGVQLLKGGPNNLGGPGEYPPPRIFFEILIANGAFLINLDHQLRAEISPIFSQYFS